jgi:hypothetical protein
MWSVVINSTDRRDKMRWLSYFPPFSIIWPKASRSSTVETSPPAPDSKAGGLAHWLSSTPSKTSSSHLELSVQGLGLREVLDGVDERLDAFGHGVLLMLLVRSPTHLRGE